MPSTSFWMRNSVEPVGGGAVDDGAGADRWLRAGRRADVAEVQLGHVVELGHLLARWTRQLGRIALRQGLVVVAQIDQVVEHVGAGLTDVRRVEADQLAGAAEPIDHVELRHHQRRAANEAVVVGFDQRQPLEPLSDPERGHAGDGLEIEHHDRAADRDVGRLEPLVDHALHAHQRPARVRNARDLCSPLAAHAPTSRNHTRIRAPPPLEPRIPQCLCPSPDFELLTILLQSPRQWRPTGTAVTGRRSNAAGADLRLRTMSHLSLHVRAGPGLNSASRDRGQGSEESAQDPSRHRSPEGDPLTGARRRRPRCRSPASAAGSPSRAAA